MECQSQVEMYELITERLVLIWWLKIRVLPFKLDISIPGATFYRNKISLNFLSHLCQKD